MCPSVCRSVGQSVPQFSFFRKQENSYIVPVQLPRLMPGIRSCFSVTHFPPLFPPPSPLTHSRVLNGNNPLPNNVKLSPYIVYPAQLGNLAYLPTELLGPPPTLTFGDSRTPIAQHETLRSRTPKARTSSTRTSSTRGHGGSSAKK